MNQQPCADEEELKYRFQSMIRADHATYAAFQRPRYLQLIRRIEQIVGHRRKKESGDYRILKRFEVCVINGEKRLMKKATGKVFVCTDELFEIIKKAHSDTKQRGESKTLSELAKTYANITRDQVKAFLHLCQCELCIRTKNQAVKIPKFDLELRSGLSSSESHYIPSDARGFDPLQQCEVVLKEEKDDELPFEDDVSISVAGTSKGTPQSATPQKSDKSNGYPVPPTRRRGRPRQDEDVDVMKQCEVLMKDDAIAEDTRLEFEDSFCTEPSRTSTSPIHLVNGHRSPPIGDALRNSMDHPAGTLQTEGFGTLLQQLAECQRQILYVESRRLALEEVRLQVDQQVASNLIEIVNHLKQTNDKN